jgi:hypothetical protein
MVATVQVPHQVLEALSTYLEKPQPNKPNESLVFSEYQDPDNIERFLNFRAAAVAALNKLQESPQLWGCPQPSILCYQPRDQSFQEHNVLDDINNRPNSSERLISFSNIILLLSATWCETMLRRNPARDTARVLSTVSQYPVIDISAFFARMVASMDTYEGYIATATEFHRRLNEIDPRYNNPNGIPFWRVPTLDNEGYVMMSTAYLRENNVYIIVGNKQGEHKFSSKKFLEKLVEGALKGYIVGNPPFNGPEYVVMALFKDKFLPIDDGVFPPQVVTANNILTDLDPLYTLEKFLQNPFQNIVYAKY